MSDNARIQTTQNVAISYETASVGERVLARLLDCIAFGIYLFLAYYFVNNYIIQNYDWSESHDTEILINMLIPIPVLTYTLWCEPVFNGRSFGKMIVGIKVIKANGKPAGFGDFAFRWMTRLLEGEAGIFSWLALPVAIVSGKGQRIGDMIAGTIVIRTRNKKITLNNTVLHQLNPDYRIVFPQVAVLNDRDINIIRDVLQQAYATSNYNLAEYLAHKVKTVMGVYPPPQQLPAPQFLNIVMADYAHYAAGR